MWVTSSFNPFGRAALAERCSKERANRRQQNSSAAAELLHELSPRAAEPFIEINCGALPDSPIESELFGHEKGAFAGAIQRRLGVFERARGGTVFLDEVGELGPSAQTRLLRVLQTKRFERAGGAETLSASSPSRECT